jgi:hypothetical protein
MKNIWCLALVFLLMSCGNSGLKERDKYRNLIKQGKVKEAIQFVEENDFFNEEDNALLKNLELGMGHHLAGNYYQSTKYLDKAKQIHQKLFTVSLSKKAGSLVTNENFDVYYGYTYERSLIHFYLSLNHFLTYQKGYYEAYTAKDKDGNKKEVAKKELSITEKQTELQGARAELLGWDTYLKDQANQKKGRSVFKVDLLAKTYGGFIHEAIGTSSDLQIALRLYKDAKLFLFRNYNAYSTFNKVNKKFRKDYKKLPKMKEDEVKKKYVKQTPFQKNLKEFLDYKILRLTKKVDGRNYKKMLKRHKPSKAVLAKLKKTKADSNVGVVYMDGFIPAKIPSKQYYGFGAVLNDPKASGPAKAAAAIGAVAISLFAAQTLGLMPPPRRYTPIGAEFGYQTARLTGEHAAIAFELPKIKAKPVKKSSSVFFAQGEGKKGIKLDIPVINPMGDIASEAIIEDSSSKYKKLGSRLVIKHLTAIMASYATYKALKNSGKAGFLAKQAAVLQYLAASKGIEASEKADVRYWSTLPATIRFADIALPKGDYQATLKEFAGKNVTKSLPLGDISANAGKKIISKRSL